MSQPTMVDSLAGACAPSPPLAPFLPEASVVTRRLQLTGGFFNQIWGLQTLIMDAYDSKRPLLLPTFESHLPAQSMGLRSTASNAPVGLPFSALFHADCFAADLREHGVVVLNAPPTGAQLVNPCNSTKRGPALLISLFNRYRWYLKARADGSREVHPIEAVVYRALRPSARLLARTQVFMSSIGLGGDYGCVHARIENDMRKWWYHVGRVRPLSMSGILGLLGRVETVRRTSTIFVAVGSDLRSSDEQMLLRKRTPWNSTLARRAVLGDGTGKLINSPTAPLQNGSEPELTYIESALVDALVCRGALWFAGWTSSAFTATLAHYRYLDHAAEGENGRGYFAYCGASQGNSNGSILLQPPAESIVMHTCKATTTSNRSAFELGRARDRVGREYKPTRKAQMKFKDLRSNALIENMDKKANYTSQANTEAKDKQVFKLTPKEVYEVFQHGAQYLRKPVKAESSEQPRSRMMVGEPRREDAPTISHLNHSKAVLSNASATLWDMSAAPGLYAVAPGPAAESWPGAGVFHGERGILCRPRGVQVNTTTLPMVCATSSGNPEMKAGLEAINGPNYAHWLFALVYPLLASVDDTLNRTGAQHVNLLLTWGRNARYNYFSPTLGSLLDADCQFNTYSPLAVSDARHCTTLARLHVSRMSWYARPFWSRAWAFADSISAWLGHVRSSLVCQGTSLNAVGRVIVMLRNDHVAKNRESWNRHVWGLEKACTPAFQEWAIGRLGVQLECIRLNHSMPMRQVAKLVGGGDADPTIGMLAGHGAGLANIVFLRPGAVMLEIDAAVNARNDRNMFQQLAWHIGVRSYKIWLNREGKRHFPAVTPAHYRPSIRNASKLTVQQGCYCASVTVPPSLLEEMMRNASSLARGCADNHTEHHAVKAWAEQTFRSTYPVAPE